MAQFDFSKRARDGADFRSDLFSLAQSGPALKPVTAKVKTIIDPVSIT
jgi:hypothetical protein